MSLGIYPSSQNPATNLVDPASCHMLLSRTKPCKCQWTRVLALRGDCVRLIKRLIVYPTERAFVPSDGITALTGRLIPGRQILDHSHHLTGEIWRGGVKDAIGRNKDHRSSSLEQMELLTQANVAEAPRGFLWCGVGRIHHLSGRR